MALKILLADDSMTAQKMGQKILADAGYDVVAVSNGAAAVKKIASEKPDIAVLDVYMPGYTGLEVCERVRGAQETSKLPVLLTVGKMEMGAFKPEDANRVKADGVVIKPFEASDLLAAVKKIEEKLAAAPPPEEPEYQKTLKLNVAELLKQDTSYQEWQVAAPEHKDEEADVQSGPVKVKTEVPDDVGGSAVFGDMLGEEPVEARAAALETAPPAVPETPAAFATAPSVAIEPVQSPIPLETAANTQKYAAPSSSPVADPHLEPTSAKHDAPVEHAPDPHFEPTVSQEHIDVTHHGQDPALVTDASEMASAFVTKFGVDNPEPIVVGVASEAGIDGLYTEAPAAPAEESPEVAASVGKLEATEAEADSVEIVEEGESEPPAAEEDDFEKRVAAAMNTYEAPAETRQETPAEPPVEVAAAPAAEPEPAPMAAAAAAAASPSAPAWTAHEAAVEEAEATSSLDQEMLKAFNASLPEPEPAPAPEPVVEAAPEPVATAPAAPENVPDIDLAKAMAAAVAPDAPPIAAAAAAAVGSQSAVDPQKLAEAIHRAIDRLKPDLIANIAKELEQK